MTDGIDDPDERNSRTMDMTTPTMSLEEDQALLGAWCRGDKAAGDRLIRYHFDWVSRAVLRWVDGDVTVAMDLVQAAFEVALKKKAEIRGPFGPYVRGIARMKVLERLRGKDRLVHELASSIRESARGAESVLLGVEQEQVAIAALRRLPPEHQDLMYLRHVQGMKLRELAELRGMTTSKLAGILRRAEQWLAHEVEQLAESRPVGESTLLGVTTWLRRREHDHDHDHDEDDHDPQHGGHDA
jgi:RNA polymerase sigma-70 factor (ECF subfamily)